MQRSARLVINVLLLIMTSWPTGRKRKQIQLQYQAQETISPPISTVLYSGFRWDLRNSCKWRLEVGQLTDLLVRIYVCLRNQETSATHTQESFWHIPNTTLTRESTGPRVSTHCSSWHQEQEADGPPPCTELLHIVQPYLALRNSNWVIPYQVNTKKLTPLSDFS